MFCKKHTQEELIPIGKTQRLKCRACNREHRKKWWESNKKIQSQRTQRNITKAKELARAFIYEYLKTHPCTECGVSDPDMLQFDHLDPSTKKQTISNMVLSGYSIESIKQEIQKCQVLCANHHQKKTRQQFGWFQYGP